MVAVVVIEVGQRLGREDLRRRDHRVADILAGEPATDRVDGEAADDLGKEGERRPQGAALRQFVEERAALAADRIADDTDAELAGDFQRAEDRVVVDAEDDVDAGVCAHGIRRLADGLLEDAAPVDTVGDELAGEGIGEAGDEALDALARVGQRLERDEEHLRRRGARAMLAPRLGAEPMGSGVVGGSQVDAADLGRGFGEEGGPPPHRLLPQRVGPAAAHRRQHEAVEGALDVVGGNGRRGRLDLHGAAMGAAELALSLEPRQVAPERHRGNAGTLLEHGVNGRHAPLPEQRKNCRLAFLCDHF